MTDAVIRGSQAADNRLDHNTKALIEPIWSGSPWKLAAPVPDREVRIDARIGGNECSDRIWNASLQKISEP